jgi:uncharacterized protein YggE
MKKISLSVAILLFAKLCFAQVSGNINYQNQTRYSDENIHIGHPVNKDITIIAKGLANVKADSYVAIFSISQSGKTTEEVNSLMDKRVSQAIADIKLKSKDVEIYTDMISFVPVYEYEVEKKIFSKKNYNEVPAGFQLKKNLHIKYNTPGLLNDIISILSANEVYDLIRVDYFSNSLETVKKELMSRAKVVLQDKMKNYEQVLSTSLATADKSLSDGYKVVLPVEMYQSYQAYNSSSLNTGKGTVNNAEKSTTLYYQPVADKEFDFVINPVVLEPVIQVMYEIVLVVNRENKPGLKAAPEYMLITPSGEVKALNLKQ